MAMHVVLGDGEMPKKELTATLSDLWGKDNDAGQTFWFLLQAKAEPTATDRALVAWFVANEIYYEVVSGDADADDKLYDTAVETHSAKSLATTVINLLKSKPEDGETADVLALFASDDPDAEEDRYLNEVAQAAVDSGYPVYALNDGMVEVDLTTGEPEPETEEAAPTPAPVSKAAAKKVAPVKAAAKKAAPKAPPADEDEPTGEITREFLEERTLDELKAIAANRGIELPPRTRHATYIDRILGADEGPGEAVVEEVEEIQGEEEVVLDVEAVLNGAGPAMLVAVMPDGTVMSRPVLAEYAMSVMTS